MNTSDMKSVQMIDYSADAVQGTLSERGKMALDYNEKGEPKWKLVEDIAIENDNVVKQTLKADEELNATKLDDLKYAVGDLKIVDVSRKPAGISANLRASGTLKPDRQTEESLNRKGFYFDHGDLLSSEGELHVTMKDGVRYVLRFGQITGKGSGEKKDAKKDSAKKPGKDGDEKSEGVNRYLLVMATFDKDALEKPTLDPLPAEAKPEPPKTDDKKDAKKDAKPDAAEAKDKKPAESKKGDAKKDAAKKDAAKKGEAKKPEAKKPEAKKNDAPKPDLKAERDRIEKENKRKQDEYNDKIKAGQKHAGELNARFADWYYVISDSVYQKIHLGRKDIIQKKEKKDEKKDGQSGDAHAGHDHAGHDHADHDDHDHDAEVPKPPANSPAEFNELKKPAAKSEAE
jgi:hypothetical protein